MGLGKTAKTFGNIRLELAEKIHDALSKRAKKNPTNVLNSKRQEAQAIIWRELIQRREVRTTKIERQACGMEN